MPLTAPIIASLTAVHVDARARQVVHPTPIVIRLAKATDAVIALTVRESDNDRANIAGAAIVLTVRAALGDEAATISRIATITDGPNGECRFPLTQSDTAELAVGSYLYSIEATWPGGDREQLVVKTEFLVVATVGVAGEPLTSPVPETVVGYGLPDPTGHVGDVLAVSDDDPAALEWQTPSTSGGTVTSVALSVPAILQVAGSPVTEAGTLAVTLAEQAANRVLAGPATGTNAAPTFRALAAADIPSLSYDAAGAAAAAQSAAATDASTKANAAQVAAQAASQPLDSDLTAIAAMTGTKGRAIRRADGAWVTERVFNVCDYGALGDSVLGSSATGTDDTSAFQAAIAALVAAEGGVLLVPAVKANGAQAIYRLRSQINWDAGGLYNYFEVDARGASFWIDHQNFHNVVFQITNVSTLRWRGGVFFGWKGDIPATVPSAAPITNLFYTGSTKFILQDVTFHGVYLDQDTGSYPDAAVIVGDHLAIINCTFESIVNTSAAPCILGRNWNQVELQDVTIADFITYAGQSFSLGSGVSPMIVLGAPAVSTGASVYGRGTAEFHNVTLDEAAGGVVVGNLSASTLAANFTQPAVYPASVTVQFSSTSWMRAQEVIKIVGGGYYQVSSIVDGTHAVLFNLNSSGNAAISSTVSAAGNPLVTTEAKVQSVLFESPRMNVTPSGGSIGIDLRSVRRAVVRGAWMREGGAGSKAIKGRHCDAIIIDGSNTRYDDNSSLDALDIDSTCGTVRISDSHFDRAGITAVNLVDGDV